MSIEVIKGAQRKKGKGEEGRRYGTDSIRGDNMQERKERRKKEEDREREEQQRTKRIGIRGNRRTRSRGGRQKEMSARSMEKITIKAHNKTTQDTELNHETQIHVTES